MGLVTGPLTHTVVSDARRNQERQRQTRAFCKHPHRTEGLCRNCPRLEPAAPAFKVTDRRASARALSAWQAPPARSAGAELTTRDPGSGELVGKVTTAPTVFVPPQREPEPELPTLNEVLEATRAYLRYAGTLTHSKDPDAPSILGWGSEAALDAATTWVAHTWARKSCSVPGHKHEMGIPGPLELRVSPRFGLFAELEGSGKTALVETMMRVSANPRLDDEPTGPVLPRLISGKHATIFLDEGDEFWGATGGRKGMARSIINSGYRKGGISSHASGPDDVVDLHTFGPLAMAAIATVEQNTGSKLRALLSRFIIVRLTQAPKGYRLPLLTENDLEMVSQIALHLRLLMEEAAPRLATAHATMPAWMTPRQAELWETLAIIAAEAGGLWPGRITASAEWLANDGEKKAKAAAGWAVAKTGMAAWNTAGGA